METITPAVDAPAELSNLFDMRGKVVFMPGGYGGIGEAVAWALALAGAHVTVAGRNEEKAERLAGALVEHGLSADGLALDVESVASVRSTARGLAERRGRIDVLVNCVGIQREEPLLEVTEDAFDEVYRVNLKAAMFLAQSVARHQIAAGAGGRQVHLLSVRSQLGLRDRGYSAYCSTKGGMVMLIRQQWPVEHVVKVLCRYHPDDSCETKASQEDTVARLARAARANGLELLLEVSASDIAPTDEHTTAGIIQRLYDVGVRPDWWKLEPVQGDAAWALVCEAVERNDPWCRGIVVLGRGESEETLAAAFDAAARHAPVKGFAVGRTIFASAARGWVAGEMTDDEAVSDMAARYRRLCTSWDAARGVRTR